jgi:hypothetical protein
MRRIFQKKASIGVTKKCLKIERAQVFYMWA